MTYIQHAAHLWQTCGCIDARGRIYLMETYVGALDAGTSGTARYRGMGRALVLVTRDPVQVIAHWLTSPSAVRRRMRQHAATRRIGR